MLERIKQERVRWRQNHPHAFWAKPKSNEDGTTSLTEWNAAIPGPKGSPWAGGLFAMRISFPEDYPTTAPRMYFTPCLFHPNVYPSGEVCSSIFNSNWRSEMSIADLLVSVQALLASPNPSSPAQVEAVLLFTQDRDAYDERVGMLAKQQSIIAAYGPNTSADNDAAVELSFKQRFLAEDIPSVHTSVLPKVNVVVDLSENARENRQAV